MAKAAFTLDKVRQEILTSSLARTNRFEVLITPPIGLKGDYKSDFISMYVEQASLPALNIFSKSFKIKYLRITGKSSNDQFWFMLKG